MKSPLGGGRLQRSTEGAGEVSILIRVKSPLGGQGRARHHEVRGRVVSILIRVKSPLGESRRGTRTSGSSCLNSYSCEVPPGGTLAAATGTSTSAASLNSYSCEVPPGGSHGCRSRTPGAHVRVSILIRVKSPLGGRSGRPRRRRAGRSLNSYSCEVPPGGWPRVRRVRLHPEVSILIRVKSPLGAGGGEVVLRDLERLSQFLFV